MDENLEELAPCPICGWDDSSDDPVVIMVTRDNVGDWDGPRLTCPGCHCSMPEERWPLKGAERVSTSSRPFNFIGEMK